MPSPRKLTPASSSPTDTAALAARLVPDLTPDQVRQLAAAKAGIGQLVKMLRLTHTWAREIMSALRPVELKFCNRLSLAELEALGAGICIETKGKAVFTNPADDLGTEIFWAVDTEDQLSTLIDSLAALVDRDEQEEIACRRKALVGYLTKELAAAPRA